MTFSDISLQSSHLHLISVITPVYNSATTLAETIHSLLEQDYQNWEMICIVDKGTVDNSREIIIKFSQNDPRIKLIEMENNTGCGPARTLGFKHANGKYIAFLDADDIWLPKKLSLQSQFMEKNGHSFSCTGYRRMSNDGNIYERIYMPPKLIGHHDLLKNNVICCGTVMLDQTKIAPLVMQNFPGEDYILWLEITGKKGIKCHGYQEDLVRYRITNNSLSRSFFRTARQRWNVYRNIEKLSVSKSTYFFTNYVVTALLKRI